MDGNLEYYLTGGKIYIGKKELTLELLRKDSVLRALLGFGAENVKSSLPAGLNMTNRPDDTVLIDLSRRKKIKVGGDPTSSLVELKNRYCSEIGGLLYFQLYYTTFGTTMSMQANLDEDTISLKPTSGY